MRLRAGIQIILSQCFFSEKLQSNHTSLTLPQPSECMISNMTMAYSPQKFIPGGNFCCINIMSKHWHSHAQWYCIVKGSSGPYTYLRCSLWATLLPGPSPVNVQSSHLVTAKWQCKRKLLHHKPCEESFAKRHPLTPNILWWRITFISIVSSHGAQKLRRNWRPVSKPSADKH